MLNVISPEKAWQRIKENCGNMSADTESLPLWDCLGRVCAEDIRAGENIPAFDRSTVDGYAVLSSDTFGSSESLPAMLKIKGEILMGEVADAPIKSGECVKISTGGMLPEGADSALMLEYAETTSDGYLLCMKAMSPWANVTKTGDDVSVGDIVMKKGTAITSRHIGVLASLGIAEVTVYKRFRVGVISSGDEVVPITQNPKIGQVRDINSHILCALMRECGCEPKFYGIATDKKEDFEKLALKASAECDIILISGGSSAGARDMTLRVLEEMGEVYFHGIAMKPGKPTIFGKVGECAFFGLPGHPMAAYIVAMSFVVPLIERLYSVAPDPVPDKKRACQAILKENISSNHGRQEIVPVVLENEYAVPIFRKSGVISVLARADGYIVIGRNTEGLCGDEAVEVHLFQ